MPFSTSITSIHRWEFKIINFKVVHKRLQSFVERRQCFSISYQLSSALSSLNHLRMLVARLRWQVLLMQQLATFSMCFSLTVSSDSLSIAKSSEIQYKLILNWAECLNFVLMIGAQEIKESKLFLLCPFCLDVSCEHWIPRGPTTTWLDDFQTNCVFCSVL